MRLLNAPTVRLAVAFALAAQATALSASIPPSIAVKVISDDADAEATSRAVVELLASHGSFIWSPSGIAGSAVRACGNEADAQACLRSVVQRAGIEPQAPPVLIVASPAGDGRVAWSCIGGGTIAARAVDQATVIDVAEAMVGKAEARRAVRRRAVQCIRAAAAEAGGNISLD